MARLETVPRIYEEYKQQPVFLAKLGNVLSVQPKKFDLENFVPENPVMYEDEQGKTQIKGCDIENYIRWREVEGVKESNAKLVKWEDGSFTMFIGNEAFEVTITENPHTYSYIRHRGLYLKAQEASKKIMFKPCSIKHRLFIRNLENSLNPTKTTQVIHSFNNHESIKKKLEQQIDQKIRAKEKQEQNKFDKKADEEFLEDSEEQFDESELSD
jgi:RNA polymerase-associated protein LEO1